MAKVESDEEWFQARNAANIAKMADDAPLKQRAVDLMAAAEGYEYCYHFRWLGLPIIQYPQDLVALQEIVWTTKPDVIVETGVARGGSTIFFASLLQLLGGDGQVVSVDIDIRPHNRQAIETHPLSGRVTLIEGSSTDKEIAGQVAELCRGRRTLVVLDSNHTHDHVLEELRLYAPLVGSGSYLAVLDTVIEDFPAGSYPERPWDHGNNPKTAVHAFLKESDRFEIDQTINGKLLLTVAPDGYLRCVKD
jgi:cephalosporin hydroxylase